MLGEGGIGMHIRASRLPILPIFALLACGSEQRACVAPQLPDLDLTVHPPPADNGTGNISFHGPCTVQDLTDAPLSVALSCDGSPEFTMTLEVTGATGEFSWTDALPVGSSVDLRFATTYGISQSPAWVAVRRAGDTDPSLIAVKSWQPLPWFEDATDFMAPLELAFLDDADCPESEGSCGDGARRRAAVEVSLPGTDSVVVFGHNEDDVGPYHIRVGDAEIDEGNCEGVNQTWYEVLVTKQNTP